ncbi:MAG: hypothetical protein ABI970_26225, partial [Chloroflexota bacterium]
MSDNPTIPSLQRTLATALPPCLTTTEYPPFRANFAICLTRVITALQAERAKYLAPQSRVALARPPP